MCKDLVIKRRKNGGQVASPPLFLNVCITLWHFYYVYYNLDTQQISLSSTSTNEFYCPGKLCFTCTGRDIPVEIQWVVSGRIVGKYIYKHDDKYPLTYPSNLPDSFVTKATSASSNNGLTLNITTVLVRDTAAIIGSSILCESQMFKSEVYFIKAKGK